MFVRNRSIFKAFGPLARDRDHCEVSITNAGPIYWTIEYEFIRTTAIAIDPCRLMTLKVVVHISNRFGRNRVERVVTHALVADAWTNRELYLRHCLFAAFYRNCKSGVVTVTVKNNSLPDLNSIRVLEDKR